MNKENPDSMKPTENELWSVVRFVTHFGAAVDVETCTYTKYI